MQETEAQTQCSRSSTLAGELLAGTAPVVSRWVMLEVRGSWGRDPIAGALPEAALGWLARLETGPGALRVQAIKRGRRHEGPLTLFIARTSGEGAALYETEIGSYEELAGFETEGFFDDPAASGATERKEPLYLVCTHGSHDTCCGTHGVPVYTALDAGLGGCVWQTSHVGAHRFAANLICFPRGIYYGRVGPEGCATIASDYERGLITVEHLRGRCGYPREAQAAEYFLRAREGMMGLDTLTLRAVSNSVTGASRVTFSAGEAGVSYDVLLRVGGTVMVLKSCTDGAPSTIEQLELVAINRSA